MCGLAGSCCCQNIVAIKLKKKKKNLDEGLPQGHDGLKSVQDWARRKALDSQAAIAQGSATALLFWLKYFV
jgi:hypothetical protein